MPTYSYGVTSDRALSEIEVELAAYKMGAAPEHGHGGLGRTAHFKRIVEMMFGPKSECPFIWNPWSDTMIDAFHQHPVTKKEFPHIGVSGCANSNKCLAPNTPVLMFDGSIKSAKDVRVGDQLMGDDSTPRNVLETHFGRSNMVRIVPRNGGGDSWKCNDDHILTLKRGWSGKKAWRTVGKVIDISVKDFLASSPTFRRKLRLFSRGVEFQAQKVQIHPQAYGIWLGDGGTGTTRITVHDREVEVLGFLTNYFTKHGYAVRRLQYSNIDCPDYSFNKGQRGGTPTEFSVLVRRSSTSGEKRILPEYLHNSREVRLALLAGIIDSDGCACGTYFEISCSKDGLASDIAYLARSLGFRVSVTRVLSECRGMEFPSNRINIMGDVSVIPTLRKKCSPRLYRKNYDCVGFEIEQLGEGDWNGFTLDGNRRFLLGDFTVTHNSHTAALYGLINWLCAPNETFVFVTSTSISDSKHRVYKSIRKLFESVRGLPGNIVDSQAKIVTLKDNKKADDAAGIFIIAGSPSKAREGVGKIIGRKNPRVFLIADELPELSPSVLDAGFGNLVGNDLFQFIAMGNFKSRYDAFGEFIEPKDGWDSITVDSEEWECKNHGAYCIHFDGMKSPNLKAGKDIYPFLYNSKTLKEHRSSFGENSAPFMRMCRSFETGIGDDDTIYSESDFRMGKAYDKAIWRQGFVKIATADPAFTNGGDRFVLGFGKIGYSTDEVMTMEWTKHRLLREDVRIIEKRNRSFQMADQIVAACMEEGIEPKNFGLDSTATGGPLADVIDEVWGQIRAKAGLPQQKIYRVDFSGSPTERVATRDGKMANAVYDRRVTEIWYVGKEFLKGQQIRGLVPELVREAKARKYETVKGPEGLKMKAETKKDMKERLMFSPDLFEAFAVMVDLCRERHRFNPAGIPGSTTRGNSSFKELAKQMNRVYTSPAYA